MNGFKVLSICVNQIQRNRVSRDQIAGRESDIGEKLTACVG